MPRYEHDPSTVTAAIVILPKGDYEFELGQPKAFERTAKAGHQSYGIRIPLKVVGGTQDGKKTMITLYLHSEGAKQMSKRFQMAIAGYRVNDKNEKAYDEEVAGQDWSYDTDDGSVGEAWNLYKGMHIMCDLDVSMQKFTDDKGVEHEEEQQDWGVWAPIEGAEVTA